MRDRDHPLHPVRVRDVLQQPLDRHLPRAIGIHGARVHLLVERYALLAVPRHARTVDEALHFVDNRGGDGGNRRVDDVLGHDPRRKNREPLVRGGGAVIDDVGSAHDLRHLIEVVREAERVELDALRHVVLVTADHVVAAGDAIAAREERVGEVAPEKTGNAGNEHLWLCAAARHS